MSGPGLVTRSSELVVTFGILQVICVICAICVICTDAGERQPIIFLRTGVSRFHERLLRVTPSQCAQHKVLLAAIFLFESTYFDAAFSDLVQ